MLLCRQSFDINVLEVKPDQFGAVSIVETDVQVRQMTYIHCCVLVNTFSCVGVGVVCC